MNKASSALIAATILAASIIGFTSPAQASTDTVTICHATGSGKYVTATIDKDGTANGHAGHQDGQDIIPAYSWVEDKTRLYFDGQNLDLVDLIGKGCKSPATPGTVTINPPVYVPASCSRPLLPYGEVVIPADKGEGIASATTPALNAANTVWSTAYTLNANTEDRTYAWPANETGQFSFTVVPITADPMWVTDSKTGAGQCEMPDTGAKDFILPGALGLGALAVGVLMVWRRNNPTGTR
jgi:LPXTG-motif cell wall-anchored protein